MLHLDSDSYVLQDIGHEIDLSKFEIYPTFVLSILYQTDVSSSSSLNVEFIDSYTGSPVQLTNSNTGNISPAVVFPLTVVGWQFKHANLLIPVAYKLLRLKIISPLDTGVSIKAASFIPGDIPPAFVENYHLVDTDLNDIAEDLEARILGFTAAVIPTNNLEAPVATNPYLVTSNIIEYNDINKDLTFVVPGVYEILASVDSLNDVL